jgi:hypothetical protein
MFIAPKTYIQEDSFFSQVRKCFRGLKKVHGVKKVIFTRFVKMFTTQNMFSWPKNGTFTRFRKMFTGLEKITFFF